MTASNPEHKVGDVIDGTKLVLDVVAPVEGQDPETCAYVVADLGQYAQVVERIERTPAVPATTETPSSSGEGASSSTATTPTGEPFPPAQV